MGPNQPGTVPTTTVGQTGELLELVEYVLQSWIDLQNVADWGWLIKQGTLVFGPGTSTVAPSSISNFARWLPFVYEQLNTREYALCYLTSDSSTEQPVFYYPYDEFRGHYDRAPVPSGRPTYFTIKPNEDFVVYPTPDASYTLRFDYLVKAQEWVAATDGNLSPLNYPDTGKGLANQFHDIIAWMAVQKYAETRSEPALYQVSTRKVKEMLGPIRRQYLPDARLVL
jgi:hypothetical protein